MLPSFCCSERRYVSGVWPWRLKPDGLRFTATSPCTAHDVDWAFELPPRYCPKPPSRFCPARMTATPPPATLEPRIPAAASAWSTAPVSSTSLVAPGRKPKPPSRLCCFASQRAECFTPEPPVAFSASTPNAFQPLFDFHEPFLERRRSIVLTRLRPANERGETPAASSASTVRSISPMSVTPPACARM